MKSEPVHAFMYVESERVSILKKGSRTGKDSEPQSVVCSRMWGVPLELVTGVGNAMEKTLLESAGE